MFVVVKKIVVVAKRYCGHLKSRNKFQKVYGRPQKKIGYCQNVCSCCEKDCGHLKRL